MNRYIQYSRVRTDKKLCGRRMNVVVGSCSDIMQTIDHELSNVGDMNAIHVSHIRKAVVAERLK